MELNQLSGSLKNGLLPLYVIHGEEDLLRIESLDDIRAAAHQQGYLNRETFTVQDAHFDWQALLSQAAEVGLFSDKKLLEIHIPTGKVGKNGSDALLQWANRLPEDTCTVIILPKLDKSQIQSKWFTALAQKGAVLETKAISVQSLPAWIQGRLQQHHLDIEPEALALFAQRVEGNLLAAKQEIDKLALLHPEGHLLTLHDAEQAIANVARFDVFQLSAAWMGGDAARLVRLIDGLEAEDEEPVLLVWAVAEDIRTLIRLAAALKQGKTVQTVRHELRLWGDKQIFAPKAVARISVARLMLALQTCAKIDRQIKGAEQGNAWDTFRQLMLSLVV